ncbi:hypothetical protein L3Q82_021220, partial [Scortum barcoo]
AAAVKMQAAAAALTVLSVFFSLDCLRAQPSKPELTQHHDRNTDETEPTKKNQPHIIFILIDDQGFNDIGYHNPTIKTPTLDKLAAEGVTLENYYVQPICTPSRSQLMTGRYQIHTGLQHSIIRPSQPSCLPSHMDTLPERLHEAGYTTHMVGKWHLGFYRKACLPTRKGFDSFFGSLTGSVDYYSYGSCDGPGVCGYDLHDDEGVAWGQEGKYSTTLFTQRARKILETHDPTDRPLFLLLSLQLSLWWQFTLLCRLQSPTSTRTATWPTWLARRKFAHAMVSTVDEAVRNVTYALRKYGYYRNSVIIYSTDNGAQPFTGGSNWPLRGRKGTYWEGGVRGVAFVHSPLLKRRRRVSKALLHITDWFPTLVGLAGGNISKSWGLDGFDVWPTISEGQESPRQEILHNIDPLHKPPTKPKTWGASVSKLAKKKALKQKPKQKSALNLKTTKKSFSRHAAKLKLKSKPLPKLKLKLLHKSKPKPKPKTKTKVYPQSHRLSYYKPHLKSTSRAAPSVLGTSRPKSKPRCGLKYRRTTSQNQNLSRSRPPQPKSKTQLKRHSKSKYRRTLSQHQNVSRPAAPQTLQPSQTVWDTSVQAAIRVGDWKLLTGDPGHGDWVPPQKINKDKYLSSGPPHPHRTLVEPRTRRLVLPQNIRPQTRLAVQHHGRPVRRAAGPGTSPTSDPTWFSGCSPDSPSLQPNSRVPVYFPPDDPRANPDHHDGAWVPWVDEGEDEEGKYQGVYKKGRSGKKKKKKKKCRLCKLQSFFMKLNTGMMSSRI